MNCHYCNQPAHYEQDPDAPLRSAQYRCPSCHCVFTYNIFNNHINNGHRATTINAQDHYYFLIRPLHQEKCRLYKDGQLIVSLDYLPNINPSNVLRWRDALLKLKAFA